MELNRFAMAAVKRTAQNVKSLNTKKSKLIAKIEALQSEVDFLDNEINIWETPIKEKFGFTSTEILNGEADKVMEDANPSTIEEMPEEGFNEGITGVSASTLDGEMAWN